MPTWEIVPGHIATPLGFRAAAVRAGIKKAAGALDLALICSDAPETAAAGVFTSNIVAAAPVVVSRRNLAKSRGRLRAVVVNAGNANACTGRAGVRVAEQTARVAARLLGIKPEQVAVASTGVIGVPLPAASIFRQLPRLAAGLSREDAAAVAEAIMTTDTFAKSCVMRTLAGRRAVHLAGVAKGAGMIHPRMATMLAFLATDVAVDPRWLRQMLQHAVDASFNCVTVDGDTSTNDSVLLLASGCSGVRVHRAGSRWFLQGLTELCQTLARMIARDGEGARKLVTVEVRGAKTVRDADRVARAIANSPLVKTAIAGSDPNWGRILCAAGYSGAMFDPARVEIRVNDLCLCRHGVDAGFDEEEAKRRLDQREVIIQVALRQGAAAARMWTCDLTPDYITINASYRT